MEPVERDAADGNLPSGMTGIHDAFLNTCQRWMLKDEEMARLLGHRADEPQSRWFRLNRADDQFTKDERTRIRYVLFVSLGLEILFGGHVDAENEWMRTALPDLENRSPLDHMLQGELHNLSHVHELVRRERGL